VVLTTFQKLSKLPRAIPYKKDEAFPERKASSQKLNIDDLDVA
jgi:hypothetical protein